MSTKGVSDIIGILPDGRFLAIEVKKEGWQPPKPGTKAYEHFMEQKKFIDTIRRNGGVGFFANCVDHVIDNLGFRDRYLC